jgi:hypothetical protein
MFDGRGNDAPMSSEHGHHIASPANRTLSQPAASRMITPQRQVEAPACAVTGSAGWLASAVTLPSIMVARKTGGCLFAVYGSSANHLSSNPMMAWSRHSLTRSCSVHRALSRNSPGYLPYSSFGSDLAVLSGAERCHP